MNPFTNFTLKSNNPSEILSVRTKLPPATTRSLPRIFTTFLFALFVQKQSNFDLNTGKVTADSFNMLQ